MRASTIFAVVALLAVAGCGKSEAERQAEESARAAEEAARGLEEMVRSLEGLADGEGAPAGGAEPVGYRELQAVFPELDGWQKGRPTGEQMSSPVKFSQAEVTYTRGDATISATLVDSGFSQILLAPYSMFLASGFERDTGDGHEKSTTVAGHPGWERWSADAKDGEVNALVNKRFLLTLEGSGIDDLKVLHQLAQRADFARLRGDD